MSAGSLAHLEEAPYELWEGTNSFGDSFELLYYKADIERYTEIERENENEPFLCDYAYPDIASALEELGRPIRFIAVGLDFSESIRGRGYTCGPPTTKSFERNHSVRMNTTE
jgi:hypothetical protein